MHSVISMSRKHPFEDLEQLFERMSRQVESGDWTKITGGSVAVDLIDTGDAFEVTADLPGYDREDIDLTLAGDTLEIEAVRSSEFEEEVDGRYLRRERQEHSVSRSVRIPEPTNDEEASASYANGVLTVTLPKVEPTEEGRQIDIE